MCLLQLRWVAYPSAAQIQDRAFSTLAIEQPLVQATKFRDLHALLDENVNLQHIVPCKFHRLWTPFPHVLYTSTPFVDVYVTLEPGLTAGLSYVGRPLASPSLLL